MSSISLTKGQNISLTKAAPGLTRAIIGLGWDENAFDGKEFDLDASAIMLGANGKVRTPDDFIFYGKLESACGAIVHTGDNTTGDGDGDDESIIMDLTKIPADVEKVVFPVSIYSAKARAQNFGLVSNAFIRILDEKTGVEVTRYDLSEDYSTETSLVFAELYRNNGEWKFKAIGQGFTDGLGGIGRSYGLALTDEVE